ncbi:MAG: ABC transporter ATP-binding protein/permease [Trueperaceae bacterium]|nr:ABC transporter ATP-binding protein/permease [Trueperaceae bacterium]MCW5819058.1 ABC transporter ATP-binding protein [Trueperaceae bacterium]
MLLKLVARFMKPYWGTVWVIVALQFVATICTLLLPSINADIIDKGVVLGDTNYILRQGAFMLGVSLLQVLATVVAVYFAARTAMAFGRDMRSGVFAHVGDFSAREVSRFGAPSLLTRTTNDVMQVQTLVFMAFSMLVTTPIMMVGGIIMAIREDVGLSWLVAVAVPVLAGSVGVILMAMVPGFRKMQKRIDRVNQVLREQISGIRVVRAFVREPFEERRFAEANRELTDVALYVGRWMSALFPLVMLVLNASTIAVLWFGGIRVDAGHMQIGSMTAYLSYLMQILIAMLMSTMLLMLLPRATVSSGRIGEVLDTEPSVVPSSKPVAAPAARLGSLEFRNVTFSYPGATHPVLADVSFKVGPGETVAVVGSTGAGKTTLVNLVPRLFDATGGAVLVDGVDVRDYAPEALWERIGLVPQKAYLFTGTVASNLRYGDPDATDADLWRALEVAQAKDFVSAMPEGLESSIAQGGTNVSGGQRQRLAIARALVRKPVVYVFDDSFSALDVATDARLRRALEPATRDAAVLIVAQRVATIQNADRIVVLEDGRVVGMGSHAELLATSETYREIVASQEQVAA